MWLCYPQWLTAGSRPLGRQMATVKPPLDTLLQTPAARAPARARPPPFHLAMCVQMHYCVLGRQPDVASQSDTPRFVALG